MKSKKKYVPSEFKKKKKKKKRIVKSGVEEEV